MHKKWMPITAGVLDIISGIFGILQGLYIISWGSFIGFTCSVYEVWEVWGPLHIVVGVLAIIGGIYACKRKMWHLALAGAIAGIFPSAPFMVSYLEEFSIRYFMHLPTSLDFKLVFAIVAIILTVLSRKQFERK